MVVKQLNRDVSIVVVAEIKKEYCNPIWLFKNKIISDDEMQSIVDEKMKIGDKWVNFETNNFDLVCDPQRLQVRSMRQDMSSRLSELATDITRSSMAIVKAVGINATLRILINEDPEYLKFCHRCAPMDAFAPMSDNAIMLDMTFADWSTRLTPDIPQKIYNIRKLEDNTQKNNIVQLNLNSHLQVDGDLEKSLRYFKDAPKIHDEFFENCVKFIESI